MVCGSVAGERSKEVEEKWGVVGRLVPNMLA